MPRRDPFGDIEELLERMTREFEELGGGIGSRLDGGVNVDVAEDDESVTVTADLPGYDREDINVSVKDQRLTIAAEFTEETEEESEPGSEPQYHRKERSRRSVSRTVRLPAPVTEEDTTATYQNGVLTVELPKESPEETGGHNIDIS